METELDFIHQTCPLSKVSSIKPSIFGYNIAL